jgi:quercetin 2,3-dioxygenase
MITVRRSDQRGAANHGWLDTRHTFSFGRYFDRNWTQFGGLRVLNEDTVAPGAGFATHGHEEMEIFSYVLDGELAHRDSMGNEAVIRPGDLQRMSAGTGVEHSEFNPSTSRPVHFIQAWVFPAKKGLDPSYEQKSFDPAGRRGRVTTLLSPDGRDGSVTIHADAVVSSAVLGTGQSATLALTPGRRQWVQMLRGSAVVNGTALAQGDGAGVTGERELTFVGAGEGDAEAMVFDLG